MFPSNLDDMESAQPFGEPPWPRLVTCGVLAGVTLALFGALLTIIPGWSAGFPEAIGRDSERRRQDWARSYLTSILTRDLRDIAEVEKLTELPKFVRLLAEHSGQLVNYSQLASGINVNHRTGQRYVGLLEQVFLIATLQPWFTDALKRIVKSPKLHFLDSGLLAAARGLTFDRIKADRGAFGALLECFVFSEVLKLMTASDLRPPSPWASTEVPAGRSSASKAPMTGCSAMMTMPSQGA
jgi:hypothetical protein